MNKIQQQIQLLWLFSFYFVYRMIAAFFENNTEEAMAWMLFLLLYAISLGIMFFVFRNWEKRTEI